MSRNLGDGGTVRNAFHPILSLQFFFFFFSFVIDPFYELNLFDPERFLEEEGRSDGVTFCQDWSGVRNSLSFVSFFAPPPSLSCSTFFV